MPVLIEEANLSDAIQRAIERAINDFERYSEQQLRALWYSYYETRKAIEYQIALKWERWLRDPTDPLAIGRLRALQESIETEMNILNRKLHNQMPSMITGAGEKGIRAGEVEIETLLKNMKKTIRPSFTVVNRAAIEVYANYALQLSDADTVQALRQIQARLQLGLIRGDTIGKLTTDIRQLIGATFGKPDVGLTAKAKRIARTEMARAFSAGHTAFGKSTDWIIGERWHTNPMAPWPCPQCEAMEGKEFYYSRGESPPLPLHPMCYHKDTEVYTNEGWKFFKDLQGNEEILSLNPETFELEWLPYLNHISYKFKGELYRLHNRWFDLIITPDHQNLFGRRIDPKDRKKIRWEIRSTENMIKYSEFRIPRTIVWKGSNPKFIEINNLQIKTEDFCKFMGYFLSEGSITKRYKNCYQISIAQSNNKIKRIFDDIRKIPVKFDLGKDHIYCFDKRLTEYLIQFGKSYQKYIPKQIKELSSELIKVFLDAYCYGDGHIRTNNWEERNLMSHEKVFSTSSKKMADDIGELILKAGGYPSYNIFYVKGKRQRFKNGEYIINNNQYTISWNKSKTAIFANGKGIEKFGYNDFVYDIELPRNHVLWVRYNGKTCFSGNCRCFATFIYHQNLFTKDELAQLKREVRGKI